MKKIFVVLLICLLPVCASAEGWFYGAASLACADSSCTGFLVCQNLETATTGWDNSETWNASGSGHTVSPADTTATILRGTQQLKASASTYYIIRSPALSGDPSEVWAHFKFKSPDVTTTSHVIFSFCDSGITSRAQIRIAADGKLVIYHGTANATTTAALSDNTLYHIWMYYKTATIAGNDGVAWVAFSETTTPPESGDQFKQVTTGTSDADIRYGRLEGAATTEYYDQILIKASSIGVVCD